MAELLVETFLMATLMVVLLLVALFGVAYLMAEAELLLAELF